MWQPPVVTITASSTHSWRESLPPLLHRQNTPPAAAVAPRHPSGGGQHLASSSTLGAAAAWGRVTARRQGRRRHAAAAVSAAGWTRAAACRPCARRSATPQPAESNHRASAIIYKHESSSAATDMQWFVATHAQFSDAAACKKQLKKRQRSSMSDQHAQVSCTNGLTNV